MKEKEENKSCIEKSIKQIEETISKCDTYMGTVHIEWDDDAPVTPFGQFVFFAQFLKTCKLFDNWVETCPNWGNTKLFSVAAKQQATVNLLGTYLLTIIAGHKRYAHVTAIRHDKVNSQLLGMTKIYSEDTIRRAFRDTDKEQSKVWLDNSLNYCYKPFLKEEWILDVDTTVKVLYGEQEGAEIGYNPQKPGRPSHVIHSYMMAEARLILDCEVQEGTHTAASYSMPKLLSLLNGWSVEERPSLVRGDCAFGNDPVLSPLEKLGIPYLFKMKQSPKVKSLIQLLDQKDSKWSDAGQGWQGISSFLKLSGWEQERRVVVLRRERKDAQGMPIKKKRKCKRKQDTKQQWLPGIDWDQYLVKETSHEYMVLVTTVTEEMLADIILGQKDSNSPSSNSVISSQEGIEKKPSVSTPNTPAEVTKEVGMPLAGSTDYYIYAIAQLYRDRATCENNFDELKRQWGWGGFVTQDLLRSQISARIVALIYNWWTLFVRWIDPDKHREGITSRPLMLHGVARQVNHGGKTTLKITHLHAKRGKIQEAIFLIQSFLQKIKTYAERGMSHLEKWAQILSEIFKEFLNGKTLSCDSS